MQEKHSPRLFPIAAILAVLANLVFTYARSYEGDQGYWFSWIQHIQQNGFANFPGNYPPVYLLWLWVVAQIHTLLGVLLHQGLALKFFCLWPVYFAHVFLVRQVDTLIAPRPWSNSKKLAILLAVALNPALLLDGPIWGQVDLLPMIFITLAFTSYFIRTQRHFSFLWFVLALLCKFQTIAFLPVLGALYLLRVKKLWKSIPIAMVGVALVFLPFILSGSLSTVLHNAYGRAAGFYPYATYNAANLWMFVLGNVVPETTVPILGTTATAMPLSLLSAKMLGMILFSLLSLAVFVLSFRIKRLSQAAMFGTLMATAFFFLLPQMHERYLLPAIPIALIWLASDFRSWKWVALVTLVCTLNILMINGIQGDLFWAPLSIISTITFFVLALRSLLPGTWKKGAALTSKIPLPHWTPEILLAVLLLLQTLQFVILNRPEDYTLQANEQWLSALPRVEMSQNYKYPLENLSVDKHPLTVNGKIYLQGIGTHAPSQLTYLLPPQSKRLRFAVGLDDEVTGGKLRFRVELDGREIWASNTMESKTDAVEVDLDVRGGSRVSLITDPVGENSNDHANWLTPRIESNEVDGNSMALMDQEFLSVEQSYKSPQRGLSIEGNPLRVGSISTANGIGTHASSRIQFAVPEQACGLDFQVGMDAEVLSTGKALFRILTEGKVLWESDTAFAGKEPFAATIPLHGIRSITLETDSLESANSDHTDWLNARFISQECPSREP